MYNEEGMNMFLRCCSDGLSANKQATVYLTTRPELIEGAERFGNRLQEVGLRLNKVHRHFSRYRLPDHTRQLAFAELKGSGLPLQLLWTLLNVPYYYADMLELKKI
jgi:hypothetical protein